MLVLPGWVVLAGRQAALQQGNDLSREAAKIDQDALLHFERLKIILFDLQGVQRAEILLVPYLDDQHLHKASF